VPHTIWLRQWNPEGRAGYICDWVR